MINSAKDNSTPTVADVLLDSGSGKGAVPVWLVRPGDPRMAELDGTAQAWLGALRFTPSARKQALVPGADGRIASVLLGMGNGRAGDPSGPSALLAGLLPQTLPAATYAFDPETQDLRLALLAWGLGAYRFQRYKSAGIDPPAKIVVPEFVDRAALVNEIEAVWLGRDLINTPASDLGPEDLETAARELAARHGAQCTSIVGDDLLAENFPMIHA
ncbi:MAG: leucyl aminopeptidase, partial [Gordonia sp.]|nr:leucyl aminopeptidase [Gordonia sp. (in: high G+C Gram-positive bacteria)]